MNWLERNEQQQTYLSEVIKLNNFQLIKEYLKNGAIISIFVQGYLNNSLVCTLPLTIQPLSSVFIYPPPLTNIDTNIIHLIDEYLNEWLLELYNKKNLPLLKNNNNDNNNNNQNNEEKKNDENNNIPKKLEVGDIVKRGKNWTSGNEDGDPPDVGVVVAYISPSGPLFKNVAVTWESGSTFVYVYDTNSDIFEVEFVEVGTQKSLKKIPKFSKSSSPPIKAKFKRGDLVQLKSNTTKIGLVTKTSLNQLPYQPGMGGGFGQPMIQNQIGQKVNVSFLDGTVDEISSEDLYLADGSKLNDHHNIPLIPGNRRYISDTSSSSSSSTSSSTKLIDVKCHLGHSMCLQSGFPFTSPGGLFGGGNPGFGGFGRMGFGQLVYCSICNTQNLQNEPCYYSCPMRSQCNFNVCINCSKITQKSNSTRRPIQSGDKVQLNYHDGSLNCLGNVHDKLIGTVLSVNNGSCSVECHDPRSPYRGVSMISEAFLNIVEDYETIPLQIGDRVVLTDDYIKNNPKNHLNLGENEDGSKIVGIVVFAPPLCQIDNISEQRPILIIPEKNNNKFEINDNVENNTNENNNNNNENNNNNKSSTYLFKSSWIERYEKIDKFKVGDRVQLNISNWKENQLETKGKCLGKPRDFRYGIIRSIGNTHNGSQRNIEVALITKIESEKENKDNKENDDDNKNNDNDNKEKNSTPLVSLYPAYSLTHANLFTVYNSKKMKESLCLKISQLTEVANFKINVEDLIEETKLSVWSQLWTHCAGSIGADEYFNLKDQWESEVDYSWDTQLEKSRLNYLLKLEQDDIEEESKKFNYSKNSNIELNKWSCKKCGYLENKINDPSCRLCSAELIRWECCSCLFLNSGGSFICVVCGSSKERSDAVNLYFKEMTEKALEESSKKEKSETSTDDNNDDEKNDENNNEKNNSSQQFSFSSPPVTTSGFGITPSFGGGFGVAGSATSSGFFGAPASSSFGFQSSSSLAPPPSTTTTTTAISSFSFGATNTGFSGSSAPTIQINSNSGGFSFNKPSIETSQKTEINEDEKSEEPKVEEVKDDESKEDENEINDEKIDELKDDENKESNESNESNENTLEEKESNKDDSEEKIKPSTELETNKIKSTKVVSFENEKKQFPSPIQPTKTPTPTTTTTTTGFGGPIPPTNIFGSVAISPGYGIPPPGYRPPTLGFGGPPATFGAAATPFGIPKPITEEGLADSNKLNQMKQRVVNPILSRLNSNLKLTPQLITEIPNINNNNPNTPFFNQMVSPMMNAAMNNAMNTPMNNLIDNNDENEEGNVSKAIKLNFNLDNNFESNRNSYLTELRWHTIGDNNNNNNDNNNEQEEQEEKHDLDEDLELPPPPSLLSEYERTTSVIFVKRKEFVPFTDFSHLIKSKDKLGNSILHHIAYMKFHKSYQTLIKLGISKWSLNNMGICPEAIIKEIGTLSSTPPSNPDLETRSGNHELPLSSFDNITSTLFEKICKRNLLPNDLIQPLFQMSQNYSSPNSLSNLIDSMLKFDKETSLELARDSIDHNLSIHSRLYYAIALLDAGYGYRAAQKEINLYYDELRKLSKIEIDPLILYALYMIGKDNHTGMKSSRLFTADALAAFRCFPIQAEMWLTEEDNLDKTLSSSSSSSTLRNNQNGEDEKDNNNDNDDDNEDDSDDEFDDYDGSPNEQLIADANKLWKIAKENHKIESPSMDKLMELTGLSEVKSRAINVCKEVLLSKKRPKHIQAQVTMNFLFVGNPGTGKTTVATLLASAMVELGYRKNPIPVITSANDILSEQDPSAAFQTMVQSAENGTLFIDEAYHFNPAPRGSTSNASNKVLDYLMKISETKRDSITFILAGYKEEILQLLTYNPGFPSRFPRELMFHFPDYTESQICSIFKNMVKSRNFKLESKKECGVSIARVVAQRIAKGSGKKGFGNGREVRVYLEKFITRQVDRLGTLELYNLPISENDYATLTRSDTIGERPNFENSPIMKELNSMIGLEKVKNTIKGLMNLQLQNYDNEMRGERIQKISLNRVFLGSSGTGKTTVARLYGRLLKEFGYLSDGDLIEVKPSDLKGQAIGEAAVKVANLIDNARGKVLFIDEAYGLDPTRRNNGFGGEVIDTLVEKLDRSPGADIAVILAGYEPQMRELFKNANNQGFSSRFNLEEAILFEDLSNDNLKLILLDRIRKEGLRASIDTIDTAIKLISQRRRLDGFSNASEVDIILNRAKVKLATRKQLNAIKSSSSSPSPSSTSTSYSTTSTIISRGLSSLSNQNNNINNNNNNNEIITTLFDPYELIEEDFRSAETSAEKARDAFGDLENIDHILQVLQELEDTMNQAKSEGRSVADILDDGHMIFTGGPGTGKTTVAQRFGQMFYNLELLPRPDVEIVTAANLISRYMGNTGPNVVDAMRRAKGGILFIDEAYGMVPKHGSYGAEAIQALVDNITLPEFRGNLIIILGGYHDSIEELFGVNPGFRSRFDKRRIEFPSWTGEMATKATINQIIKDGLTITHEGKELLLSLYNQLSNLPEWGSARDVYRNILPTMYSKRSKRLAEKARQEKTIESTIEISKQKKQRRREEKNSEPYTAIDVREAFQSSITSRTQFQIKQQNNSLNKLKSSNFNNSEIFTLADTNNQIETEVITKKNYKVNEKNNDEENDNDKDSNDNDIGKSFDEFFEETIKELNLSQQQMRDMIINKNYSSNFVNLLKTKTNITNHENLIQQLDKHIEKLKIIQNKAATNGIHDIKVLEKLRRIGKCPMLFDWIKIEGGYRCAGGSHYVSDYEISLISDVV